MMKDIIIKYWIYLIFLVPMACHEDYELDGTPPTASDAVFTMTPTDDNDNIIVFSSNSDSFLKTWNLGNGQTGKGQNITGRYPDAGTYTVTLTLYNEAGSVTGTQQVDIAVSDPTLLDKPIYNMLTGGADAPEGKTWVIDSARSGHFGVGPNPSDPAQGDVPNYYAAQPNEKQGGGMYDDKYTFMLAAYGFDMETNGNVYLNAGQAGEFSGAVKSPVGDFIAPYSAPDNLSWNLVETEGEYPTLTISDGGFLGFYTGVKTYQIVKLEENEMFLRYLDSTTPDLAWYIRLIPEGYDSGGDDGGGEEGGGDETVSLPITFEDAEPPVFEVFGGSSYAVIDNPDASGINTSAKVAETVHGGETWAGLFVNLTEPLDFSSLNTISIKVWAPQTGTFRLKFENVDNTDDFVEIDAEVTTSEQWEEITFDVSEVPSDTYARIVVFPGWDIADAGTFYFDDITLYAESAPLSLDDLTGGSSKVWKLKPAAGSFGVGPEKGSDAYYPNGEDLSISRPCLFNDEFIFKTGDAYEYNAQGDIYGEDYMGLSNGCQDESNLIGTDAEPWASGTHSFAFTPATDTDPAYITVTGTGAFIALPKAYNGGEYESAPPDTDASVTYEVLSYVAGDTETLTITIDVSEDASAFWTFVLESQ